MGRDGLPLTERLGRERHAPVFLAGDRARGLIVLEDLAGAGLPSLVGPLLNGSAEAATKAPATPMQEVSAGCAATLGCVDGHAEILRRASSWSRCAPAGRWFGVARECRRQGRGFAGRRGAGRRDRCDRRSHGRSRALARPGTSRSLPGQCPVPRHRGAPAGLRVRGPRPCAARRQLPAHGLPDLLVRRPCADRSGRGDGRCLPARTRHSVAGRAGRRLRSGDGAFPFRPDVRQPVLVARRRTQGRRHLGISGNRARLLRHLEAAIAGAEKAGVLRSLCAAAARWRIDLGARWPEAMPLALYPAFAA